MAIDKNSKAYNSLLNKGYTDEQIAQMYDTASKQGTTKGVVPTTYDPMADLTPEYIANMDMNKQIRGANQSFSQYGDDSSRDKQDTRGGLNQKYTGEGVKTSDINYNPDITTKDLNPNFVYGKQSQVYGTDHPGYISQRNDDIASALYNEGLVSREDVTRFLMAQNGFTNSSEEDRLNTIESVWKRLGAIAEQNREKPDPSKAEELLTDTSGKIYGKVTADEGNPKEGIDTLADDNSVFRMMQESRAANLKAFITYNPSDIAELMLSGTSPFSDQTLRDAQQYYPEFMAQVNAEKKKKQTQQNVNAIASGGEMTTDTNGQSNINNNINNFATQNATSIKSSVEITKDVNNAMAESQTANEASETMASIEEDMAILKNRMKNLRQEANAAFKGDVPDYLVNAYINNKAQEIQNQMSILEDRYNAAYQRYTTELQQKQWEKEYQLKEKELALKEKMFKAEQTAAKQGITLDDDSKDSTAAKNEGDTYDVTTKSDKEVAEAVDELWDMFDNGQLGNAQCAAGIQKYYLPMLGIELPNLSSIDNKKKLINTEKGYVPKRGDLIILNSKSSPKNGHIGIVLSVSKDGYIEYMDWNGSLDKDGNGTEKVAINSISGESAKIIGFRNVNKGYEDGETKTSYNWKDSDYEAFERFLDFSDDGPSDAERKTIAKTYGFGDNLNGMYQFASEQLNNRSNTSDSSSVTLTTPEGTASTDSQGRTVITKPDGTTVTYAPGITADYKFIGNGQFDPVLGYDTSLRNLYERVIDADFNVRGLSEEYANLHGRTPEQLGQEARNYQAAKDNGTDAYEDVNRKVSRDWGFAVDKKQVYSDLNDALAKKSGILSEKDWIPFLKQLGLDPKDSNAIQKARAELDNYNKWYNEQMDDTSVYNLLHALEYIMMQDANYLQRRLIINGNEITNDEGQTQVSLGNLYGEQVDWAVYYNYILASDVFKQLTDTKAAGATLYPVSDKDMEMVRAASTILNGLASTEEFRNNIEKKYQALREYIGKPISDAEMESMWNTEGNDITNNILINPLGTLLNGLPDFSNYLTIDSARYSGLFGGYNYGKKKTTTSSTQSTNTIGQSSTGTGKKANTTSSSGTGKSGMDDIDSLING